MHPARTVSLFAIVGLLALSAHSQNFSAIEIETVPVAAGVTSEWDESMGTDFMTPENFTPLAYRSLAQ